MPNYALKPHLMEQIEQLTKEVASRTDLKTPMEIASNYAATMSEVVNDNHPHFNSETHALVKIASLANMCAHHVGQINNSSAWLLNFMENHDLETEALNETSVQQAMIYSIAKLRFACDMLLDATQMSPAQSDAVMLGIADGTKWSDQMFQAFSVYQDEQAKPLNLPADLFPGQEPEKH